MTQNTRIQEILLAVANTRAIYDALMKEVTATPHDPQELMQLVAAATVVQVANGFLSNAIEMYNATLEMRQEVRTETGRVTKHTDPNTYPETEPDNREPIPFRRKETN